jgi:hypothetical protein
MPIENLINRVNDEKLDHGLTTSDINPKHRQNYHSCIKLTERYTKSSQ